MRGGSSLSIGQRVSRNSSISPYSSSGSGRHIQAFTRGTRARIIPSPVSKVRRRQSLMLRYRPQCGQFRLHHAHAGQGPDAARRWERCVRGAAVLLAGRLTNTAVANFRRLLSSPLLRHNLGVRTPSSGEAEVFAFIQNAVAASLRSCAPERVNDFASPGFMNLLCRTVVCLG